MIWLFSHYHLKKSDFLRANLFTFQHERVVGFECIHKKHEVREISINYEYVVLEPGVEANTIISLFPDQSYLSPHFSALFIFVSIFICIFIFISVFIFIFIFGIVFVCVASSFSSSFSSASASSSSSPSSYSSSSSSHLHIHLQSHVFVS